MRKASNPLESASVVKRINYLTRREMLRQSAAGFGYLALSSLLAEEAAAEAAGSDPAGRSENPLTAKTPRAT